MDRVKLRVVSEPPVTLSPGDEISINISSKVNINRDENWVTVKITSSVLPGESGDAAYERIEKFVEAKFTSTVLRAVDLIQGLGS